MKIYILRLTLILSLLTPLAATARVSNDLESVFRGDFSQQYTYADCAENIAKLIRHAEAQGLNLDQAHAIYIVNAGNSLFGLVAAVKARGFLTRNWGFHVAFENQGMIYDFDFGDQPSVLPKAEYVTQMFLVDNSAQADWLKVPADRKLDEYEVTVVPAKAYAPRKSVADGVKMTLRQFMEQPI